MEDCFSSHFMITLLQYSFEMNEAMLRKILLQLRADAYVRLLNKPYWNEVTLKGKINPKIQLASLFLVYLLKRFRSFNA